MSFFVRVTFANVNAIRLFETTAAYQVCFFNKPEMKGSKSK